MQTFRYHTDGRWYKGNLHIHTPASDGKTPVAEVAAMYAGAGYDFLAGTDHWGDSNFAADLRAYPLLWLDGIELDRRDDRRAVTAGIRDWGLGIGLSQSVIPIHYFQGNSSLTDASPAVG